MEENTQSFERGSPSFIARKIRELYKVFGEDIKKSKWHFALNRYLRWFEEGGVEELIKSIARNKSAVVSLRDVTASDLKGHNYNVHQMIFNESVGTDENHSYNMKIWKECGGKLLDPQDIATVDGSDFALSFKGCEGPCKCVDHDAIVEEGCKKNLSTPSMKVNATGNQVSLDFVLDADANEQEALKGACARTVSSMSNGCGMGSATMVSCYDRENEAIRKEKKAKKEELKNVEIKNADVGSKIAELLGFENIALEEGTQDD